MSALGARLLVCDGNSITQGSGAAAGSAYPDQLRVLFYGQDTGVVNLGVAGKTTAQLTSDFAAKVQPYFVPGAELLFFEGVNSLGAGNTPAQEYALQQTYVAQAKAAGWRVRICTAPPVASAIAADLDTLNSLIRAGHSFADDFTDLAACPELTPAGDVANPTHYFDTIHLTATGYGVLAAKLYADL